MVAGGRNKRPSGGPKKVGCTRRAERLAGDRPTPGRLQPAAGRLNRERRSPALRKSFGLYVCLHGGKFVAKRATFCDSERLNPTMVQGELDPHRVPGLGPGDGRYVQWPRGLKAPCLRTRGI
jgi:hypothetical protein